jgi:hypothetical protein
MASLIALLNQAKKKNVGFLNPFLYENAAKGAVKDITVGTNAIKSTVKGYKAQPGWDACTGLGTPDGTKILNGKRCIPRWPQTYEQFITMVFAGNNAAAETALVTWLGIIGRQEKVDKQVLEGLPRNWGTAALPPLSAVLRGDLARINDNWWTQSDSRSEAWARFLLAVGQESPSHNPKTMERIWQTALKTVKNDPRSASGLELRRALALLYVRHSDLDVSHSKLNELVEQIFFDKMGAIQSKDLEAEQRYHTVLGLIFAGQQKVGLG